MGSCREFEGGQAGRLQLCRPTPSSVHVCARGYVCLEIKNQTENVDDTLTNNLAHHRSHFYFEGFPLAHSLRVQVIIQEKHGGRSMRQLVMLHLQLGNSDACSEILMSLHVCSVKNKIVSFKLNYLLAKEQDSGVNIPGLLTAGSKSLSSNVILVHAAL